MAGRRVLDEKSERRTRKKIVFKVFTSICILLGSIGTSACMVQEMQKRIRVLMQWQIFLTECEFILIRQRQPVEGLILQEAAKETIFQDFFRKLQIRLEKEQTQTFQEIYEEEVGEYSKKMGLKAKERSCMEEFLTICFSYEEKSMQERLDRLMEKTTMCKMILEKKYVEQKKVLLAFGTAFGIMGIIIFW